MKKHNFCRPNFTAFLGENGDKIPIYLGCNYDTITGSFTPQYIPKVLYGQYLIELANNPLFYQISAEKPDDMLKLAALQCVLFRNNEFEVYGR
jgi:hypothetical protein